MNINCMTISEKSNISIFDSNKYKNLLEERGLIEELDFYDKIPYVISNFPFLIFNSMINPLSRTVNGSPCDFKFESKRANKSGSFVVRFDKNEKLSNTKIRLLRVYFVNGILTDRRACAENARKVSKFLDNMPVTAIHNSSNGSYSDLSEWLNALKLPIVSALRGSIITAPVFEILLHLHEFLKKFTSGAAILTAHSQGCLHVKNAILELLPIHRRRIQVLFVGPAPGAYLKSHLCHQIHHLVSRGDYVGLASIGFKRENVSLIKRHVTQRGFLDHDFQSETYGPKIAESLLIFKEESVRIIKESANVLDLEINEAGEIEVNNELFVKADVVVRQFLDPLCKQDKERLEESLSCLPINEIENLILSIERGLNDRLKAEDDLYNQNVKKLRVYKSWSIAGTSVGGVATVAGVGLSVLFPLIAVPIVAIPVTGVFTGVTSSGGIGLILNGKAKKQYRKDKELAKNLILQTTEKVIEICNKVIHKKNAEILLNQLDDSKKEKITAQNERDEANQKLDNAEKSLKKLIGKSKIPLGANNSSNTDLSNIASSSGSSPFPLGTKRSIVLSNSIKALEDRFDTLENENKVLKEDNIRIVERLDLILTTLRENGLKIN